MPASFVEEKTASLAWHYRMAEAEFGAHQANELYIHLTQTFANQPVEVLPGDKVVEVRPHGITKALVVDQVMAKEEGALAVAFGDDRTDEDLFRALPKDGIAVHVGPKPSIAPYRVPDVNMTRRLLEEIARARGC